MKIVTWMNSVWGRTARVVAGVVMIAAGFLLGGGVGLVLAVVGVVPLVAGVAGVCLIAPLMHVPPRAH